MNEIQKETFGRELSATAGKVFKYLRILAGFTSYESFAFTTNFPRAQYWRVETGKHNLTLKTLAKLLKIHGLTMFDFFVLMVTIETIENEAACQTIVIAAVTRIHKAVMPSIKKLGQKNLALNYDQRTIKGARLRKKTKRVGPLKHLGLVSWPE
ncbi:hypothetical protein [Parachryseolinea silvisoli]|uniref:hypothetical protein n=1 Tax=Parachryseolinea silvisoli TaxID=2873601 RepID=UPI002265CC43|nr:hypothetical protein [Parachryseolinea silvisoli]MCD9015250.1 hypothetical protein [Parachryseolinea silvisoli]